MGVVLAVDGHPLAGPDTCGHPGDHPEEHGDARRQGDGLVGEGPVEVDRGDEDAQLGHRGGEDQREQRGSEHAGNRTTYR